MSDLYARLLTKLADLDGWTIGDDGMAGPVNFARDYGQAVGALRAVVELHKPEPTHPGPLSTLVCHGCELDGYDAEHPPWPCWTIKAIAEALGIGETPK